MVRGHEVACDSQHQQSALGAGRRSKINSFDPALPTVCPAYSTAPCLPFFHPPIQRAGVRPGSRLDLDRWVDFAAISPGNLLQVTLVQIHVRLEHTNDSGERGHGLADAATPALDLRDCNIRPGQGLSHEEAWFGSARLPGLAARGVAPRACVAVVTAAFASVVVVAVGIVVVRLTCAVEFALAG